MLAKQGEALVVAAGDFHRARTYLDLASQWFTRLGNAHRAADMMLSAGLSWETQADRRTGTDPNGRNLAEALFLEDAIQTLRKIPKEQRPSLGVDQHLARLLQRLPESGRQAIRSMTTISSGPVDITEFVRQSEQAVSGKTPLDALLTFVHLHPGARHSKLVEDAKEMMRQFPLSTMFAASIYGRDGRVIAKTPGGQYGAQADDADTRLYASVLRDLLRDMDLVCKAQLLPALMTIRNEHSVRRADLSHLLSLAPVVPPGRAEQFSKGLWEGFELDFATAIYILAPQVEHLVRWHLKEAGVTTTVVDREGIENETGLSSLVNLPEVNKIFGEDCAFELKALFCSPFGPNLRNEVAHGLLGENECHTTDIVYAWWWVLRLTLRSFLQANRPVDPVPTSGSGA